MSEANQRLLHAAAVAYAAARADYEAAQAASNAAYERLEASPETLEYQIEWNVVRRAEAAVALRLSRAEEAYRDAGGDIESPGPDG